MFKLAPSQIVNILTLRYDPSQDPLIPRLSASDFEVDNIDEGRVIHAIENSIKRSLDGIDHFSLALSSGVDSTLILALSRKLFPEARVDCICITFDDSYDESISAMEIANKLDTELHIIHIDNILRDLPEQIGIVQEPRWNLYWYYVVKNAKRFSDTLLTGDGGDELFGGYTFRYVKFLNMIRDNDTWYERAMKYIECHERDWVPDQDKLFGNNVNFSWNEILNIFKPYFDNSLDPLRQVFLADYNGKLLFDWIPTNKKFYTHFNIIGIAPMLDYNVRSIATHAPTELKYNRESNSGKIVLRRILERSGISIENEKKGFSIDPVQLWIRYGKDITKNYLYDARVVRDKWINGEWISKVFKLLEERMDIRYITKMLSLLAFEVWYRLFVTYEMSSSDKL